MKRYSRLTVFLIFLIYLSASATIINIPGDYFTIQEGIDASSDGDTVLVQPGTYVENVNFNGHNIVLGSLFLTTGDTTYISQTVIDGNDSGAVVTFENGEDGTAVITGFTLQNGSGWISGGWVFAQGGGIACIDSDPTINNNIICENYAGAEAALGGGIGCDNSSPTISNNYISGNSAQGLNVSVGGGIGCAYGSDPDIINNIIVGNLAETGPDYGNIGGGIASYESNPTIIGNVIMENSAISGGGIYFYDSHPRVTGNIVIGNTANSGGGILFSYSHVTFAGNIVSMNSAIEGGGIFCAESSPTITNSIVWANTADNGNEVFIESGSPIFIYSDIQGGWDGEGNIDADPLFRDPENGDFHLMATDCGDPSDSPCIDAGDPLICDLILDCVHGLGEIRSDMGAFGGGIDCSDIPTLSEWGMLIMALLLLAFGTVAVIYRRGAILERRI